MTMRNAEPGAPRSHWLSQICQLAYIGAGVATAAARLLRWLLTGIRLPLQNLWAAQALPARWAAIGCAGLLLAGCSQVQQEADTEAAGVADYVVPDELGNVLASSGATTPDQRGAAAQAWLADPYSAVTVSQGGVTWAVRSREGTSIRVDVYKWLESGDLLPPDQGEAAWGLACRSYDVAAEVTVKQVDCPEGTPEVP